MRNFVALLVLLAAAVAAMANNASADTSGLSVKITFPPSNGVVTVKVLVANTTGRTYPELDVYTHTISWDPLPNLLQPSGLKWASVKMKDCVHYSPCRIITDPPKNHNKRIVYSKGLGPHGSVAFIYQYPAAVHHMIVAVWVNALGSGEERSASEIAP